MDIRAVDLNLLKAFDALIRERAVTRAAGRIGLSQPAMSHALSRLRGLFADDLFVRTPNRMEPTARAREIAPLVSAAIEHIEAALNLGIGFDPAKSAGIFTAGMAEYAEVALVGRLTESFARQAPRATLRLTPVTGAEAAEQLDRGTIDVAVARLGALPTQSCCCATRLCSLPGEAIRSRRNRSRSKPMQRSTTSSSRRAAIPLARSTARLRISA
jgi:DNA-binding transcriptional LysR family regulator